MNEILKSNDACWCGSGRKYKRCHRATRGRVTRGTVSPMRKVPSWIETPDYALTGRPVLTDEPMVKSAEVIERMRRASAIAAEVLAVTSAEVRPGITTDQLDVICHEATVGLGAYPSPLNYKGFSKSLCTSVNEVICHGIPDSRPLVDGDIINLDVTVYIDGVHGDTNATYPVGHIDDESERLIRVTQECLWLGIEAVRPGRPVSDIGRAIERHATAQQLSVIRSYCGHGIGRVFHSRPQIPHYYDAGSSTVMEPGMTFTIEPMIAIGSNRNITWEDGWTVVTSDGKRSAQFEHTLLVTPAGADVLTIQAAARENEGPWIAAT
jgi:methionyl aminopeptidase